jgi:hypothetical protein
VIVTMTATDTQIYLTTEKQRQTKEKHRQIQRRRQYTETIRQKHSLKHTQRFLQSQRQRYR